MATITRLWYNREINKPWEEVVPAGPLHPGETQKVIHIIVKGPTAMLEPSDINSPPPGYEWSSAYEKWYPTYWGDSSVAYGAIDKILSYYGKKLLHHRFSFSWGLGDIEKMYSWLLSLHGMQPFSDLNIAANLEVHFPSRMHLKPLIKYTIAENRFEELENLSPVTTAFGGPDFDLARIDKTGAYSSGKIGKKITALKPLFDIYNKQAKFFDGRITPYIDFKEEHNKLVLLFDHLEDFVQFNGLQLRLNEDDALTINFDEDYNVILIQLQQKGRTIALTKGYEYYWKQREDLQRSALELLYNLEGIYKQRQKSLTWSRFIEAYLTTANVTIDFFGAPHSETLPNMWTQEQDAVNKLFQTPKQIQKEEKEVQTPSKNIEAFNQGVEDKQKDAEAKFAKIGEAMKKINSAEKLVRRFLNKYGLDRLIWAAFECIAIKAGIPAGQMPPIPGVDPYQLPAPPKVPRIPKLPTTLPVVNINKEITEQIKAALKEAALQALVSVLGAVADLIVEACKASEDPGDGVPLTQAANEFPNLSNEYKDIPPTLEGCYEEYGVPIEAGNRFLELVADNISARESCRLINGAPSREVLEIIRNLINTEAELVSLQTALPSRSEVMNFFLCIGEMLSPDYCNSILSQPPFEVPENLDVCLELLNTNATFNDIIDFYNNLVEDAEDFVTPNLNCGAGVVPSLDAMPPFAHSISTLMDAIFQIPKVNFINDLGNLKLILLKPNYGWMSPSEQKALEDAGLLPQPQERDVDPSAVDGASTFMEGLSSGGNDAAQQIANNPEIQKLGVLFSEGERARQTQITYKVVSPLGKAYKDLGTADVPLETNFEKGLAQAAAVETFAFGAVPPGQAASPGGDNAISYVISRFGTDPPDQYEDHAAPNQIVASPNLILNQNDPDAGYYGVGPDPTTYSYYHNTFKLFVDRFNTGNRALPPLTSGGTVDLFASIARYSMYMPSLLSFVNMAAYQIRKSPLFEADNVRRLSLEPLPCPAGKFSPQGKGLFDIDGLKLKGLQEFAENACTDRDCVVGPVEDTIIFTVMNAYIQILLLEQLLKNIFLVSIYGFSEYAYNPEVVLTLTQSVKRSLALTDEPMEGLTLSNLGQAAAIYVEKLVSRHIGSTAEGTIQDPFNPDGPRMTVPQNIITAAQTFEETGVAPQTLREFALDYVIKERIADLNSAILTAFGNEDGSLNSIIMRQVFPIVNPPSINAAHLLEQVNDDDGLGAKGNWDNASVREALPLHPSPARTGEEDPQNFDAPVTEFTYDMIFPSYNPDDIALREQLLIDMAVLEDASGEITDLNAWEELRTQLWDLTVTEGAPPDLVNYAKENGIFVNEKYVSFDYNYNKLEGMKFALDGSGLERNLMEGGDANLDAQEVAHRGYLKFAYDEGIKEVFNRLLPSDELTVSYKNLTPSSDTFDQDEWSAAGYPPIPPVSPSADTSGTARHVVSTERFDYFLRGLNDANLKARLGATEIDKFLRTIKVVFYRPPVRLDIGGNNSSQGLGSQGGQSAGEAVVGFLNLENYDAIRFFMSRIQRSTNGFVHPNQLPLPVLDSGNATTMPSYYLLHPNAGWLTEETGNPMGYLDTLTGLDPGTGQLDLWPTGQYIGGPFATTEYDDKMKNSSVSVFPPRNLKLQRSAAYPDWNTEGPIDTAAGRWPCDEAIGSTVTYWDCMMAKQAGSRTSLLREFLDATSRQDIGAWKVYYHGIVAKNYVPEDFGSIVDNHGDHLMTVKTMYRDFNGHIKGRLAIHKEHPDDRDSGMNDPYFEMNYLDGDHDGAWIITNQPWYRVTAHDTDDLYAPEDYRNGLGRYADVHRDKEYRIITPLDQYSANMLGALEDVPRNELENFLLDYGIGETPTPGGTLPQPGGSVDFDKNAFGGPPPESEDSWTSNQAIDHILGEVVSNVKVGSRVVYYTPPIMRQWAEQILEPGPDVKNLLKSLILIKGSHTLMDQASDLIRTKSAFILPMKDPSKSYTIGVPTTVQKEKELMSKLSYSELYPYMWSDKITAVHLEVPYIRDDIATNAFWVWKNGILAGAAQSDAFKELFRNSINSRDVITFLFLYGLLVTGGENSEYDKIFNDTKQSLRIILKAALAGDDYAYVDKESQTAADRAGLAALGLLGTAAGGFAAMGTSFILKMLIETPKLILKGLAEMVDPHVVVGKMIKDVSGQAFEMIRSSPAGGTLDDMLVQLQEKVDEDLSLLPKPLRPEFHPLGFDLIGTLPYMAILPPGPLGWAYILFDLSAEELQQMFDHQRAIEECQSGTDPYFAAPPPGLGSDSEHDTLPTSPSSTWACSDPASTGADPPPVAGGGTPAPTGGGGAGGGGAADQTSFECE